jgi:hypothetical protein
MKWEPSRAFNKHIAFVAKAAVVGKAKKRGSRMRAGSSCFEKGQRSFAAWAEIEGKGFVGRGRTAME